MLNYHMESIIWQYIYESLTKHTCTLTGGTLYVQWGTGLTSSSHIQFISTCPHIYMTL